MPCFYLLPPHNGAPPSPPSLHARSLPHYICMGINENADVVACRLPCGVPLCWPIFKFRPPGSALVCKLIQMIIMVFFRLRLQIILPRNKSWGKTPSTRQILTLTPFRRRQRVGVLARALSATFPCTLGSRVLGLRSDDLRWGSGVSVNGFLTLSPRRTTKRWWCWHR